MSLQKAIELINISTIFGSTILHDTLNLTLYEREIIGLIGASGSGKSVLLKTMMGLKQPEKGKVKIFGKDLYTDNLYHPTKQWGVSFQSGALFSDLTVLENIQIPLKENKDIYFSPDLMDHIAFLKMALVGLDAKSAYKYPSEISGGMRKRVGIARALALEPKILFLDEPTAGLDPIGAENFDHLIQTLHSYLDITVVIVTHDVDSLRAICQKIAVLVDKKIMIGSLQEIENNTHPWIQKYFNSKRGLSS